MVGCTQNLWKIAKNGKIEVEAGNPLWRPIFVDLISAYAKQIKTKTKWQKGWGEMCEMKEILDKPEKCVIFHKYDEGREKKEITITSRVIIYHRLIIMGSKF